MPVRLEGFRIQNPDPTDRLTRYLGILGGAPASIEPVLVPTVQVADLNAPEYGWLARGRRYFGGAFSGPLAGNKSIVEFSGPAGVDQLCVIDRIVARLGLAETLCMKIGASIGGPNQRVSNSDVRQNNYTGTPPGLSAVLRSSQGVLAVAASDVMWPMGDISVHEIPITPIILSGGNTLVLFPFADNVSLGVGFSWREIPLEALQK